MHNVTSARKAHLRIALEDEVRRGVGPRLLVLMVRLLVLSNFGSLARWARRSIPPLTPHCTVLVAQKLTKPIAALFGLHVQAKKHSRTDDFT